jgi:hypothetical protein
MPIEQQRASAGSLQQGLRKLERMLAQLDDRVRRWSNARWTGQARNGRPRADIVYDLAITLAELGRQAGNGAPSAADFESPVPPQLAPQAIADQLVVLGRELLNAPDAATYAEAAIAAVERVSGEILSV